MSRQRFSFIIDLLHIFQVLGLTLMLATFVWDFDRLGVYFGTTLVAFISYAVSSTTCLNACSTFSVVTSVHPARLQDDFDGPCVQTSDRLLFVIVFFFGHNQLVDFIIDRRKRRRVDLLAITALMTSRTRPFPRRPSRCPTRSRRVR